MGVRRVVFAIGLASVTSLLFGGTAMAGQQAPLTGEQLFVNFPTCIKTSPSIDGPGCAGAIANPPPPVLEGTCNPNGDSELSFSVSGAAFGPYPGTFTEEGTITIEAQDDPPVLETHPVFGPGTGPFPSGEVMRWDADFTIESGDFTITGTKHLTAAAPAPDEHGICRDFVNDDFGGTLPGPITGSIRQGFTHNLAYTATIRGPGGTDRDSGQSDSVIRDTFLVANGPPGDRVRAVAGLFGEQFASEAGNATKPGKGCGDKNHDHARENECKKPPK